MFGNFKFQPFKHYMSNKRKLSQKRHNFDLAKSDFHSPEGHSCTNLLAGDDTKSITLFMEELDEQKRQHGFLPLIFRS